MLYLDYAKPVDGGYILNLFADSVEDIKEVSDGKEFKTRNGMNYGVPKASSTIVVTAPNKDRKTFVLNDAGEWGEDIVDPNQYYTKKEADEKFAEVDALNKANDEIAKKLDIQGGSITGDLTIGGNFVVNGKTTTVESENLTVKDKLIEVAAGNTAKLTSPAGIVVPKYDGEKSGALVFDGSGIAYVGDVALNENGDINVAASDLAALAVKKDIPTDYLKGGEQTTTSKEDGGENVFTFTKSDGKTATFTVKNGTKGATGAQGEQGPAGEAGPQGLTGPVGPAGPQGAKGDAGAPGEAAGFGTPTATVDENIGIPGVTVTASGPNTDKVFAFSFTNLKGEKGVAGTPGAKGDKGEKGDAGTPGAKGADGASITAINLTKDASGSITGGTATLSNGNEVNITVTVVG